MFFVIAQMEEKGKGGGVWKIRKRSGRTRNLIGTPSTILTKVRLGLFPPPPWDCSPLFPFIFTIYCFYFQFEMKFELGTIILKIMVSVFELCVVLI